MSIPRNMNPAEPDFDLFSSPFYLIAHVDFKYHEDLDRVMQKYEVDRTTYKDVPPTLRQCLTWVAGAR